MANQDDEVLGFWLAGRWYYAEDAKAAGFETPMAACEWLKKMTLPQRYAGGRGPASTLIEPCILIAQIIDRLLALPYWRDTGATPPPRDELVATLTTAHHDCPHTCNLARIMELDDASLRHDVLGFYRYTDVVRGEFNEHGPFWPLSAERL